MGTEDKDQPGLETQKHDRRDLLKKGVAAAGVGAVVWAAPTIKGLSIVPDYASAGTATTGVITFRLNGNGPSLLGGNNWMNAAPSPSYTVTQDGPSDNQAIILTAPLGAAGNAVFTFPGGQDTDGPGVSGTVTFNVDPPFNKCVVLGGTCDWWGSTSDRGQTTFGAPGSNQSPNTTSPRAVPFSTPDGAPSGGNNFFNPVTQLNFLEVQIQCQ